jgi:hypothetical protein
MPMVKEGVGLLQHVRHRHLKNNGVISHAPASMTL